MVHFLMQSEVAVVSMVWVEKRELCKWPPFKTDSRVQRAVKDRIKPEVSWESFKIKILYESGKLKADPLTYMFMYILVYAAEKKSQIKIKTCILMKRS